MRTPMIAGNWKMNTTVSVAVALTKELHSDPHPRQDLERIVCPPEVCLVKLNFSLDKIQNVDKVICPPFVSLAPLRDLLKGSSIKLGAQNLYFEEKGAYTGEISPLMVAELCEFVIIGHSERRQYFHETGEIVNKKVKAALKVGLKPILCVGERLEEKEAGRTEEVVSEQLNSALDGVKIENTMSIAYEPVWAIGSGQAATAEQANDTIGFIRQTVSRLSGDKTAQKIRILYGGSVTAENISEFIEQPEIDGALVGGASLKTDQFFNIVKQASEISRRASS